MSDDLLTSAEVARLLKIHPKHLYRLLQRGLPGHRLGRGHWRFRQSEVLAWVQHRDAPPSRVTRPSPSPEGADLKVSLAPGRSLRAGSNRVRVGWVRTRWVAHGMGAQLPRCADALVDAELPEGRTPRTMRAQPLGDGKTLPANILVAGCAPALGMILDRLERGGSGRCHWIPANSTNALQMLTDGFVHVAGIHLEDPESGADHQELARAHFPGQRAHLIRLLRWRTGLVMRPEHGSRELGELVAPPVRWVLREAGAGAGQVLERALARIDTSTTSLHATRVVHSHHEVAQAIALGVADVGVAVEPVAHELGLRFTPLAEEGFDLLVPHDIASEQSVARVIDALDDPRLRREVGALGSYDAAAMGHAVTA